MAGPVSLVSGCVQQDRRWHDIEEIIAGRGSPALELEPILGGKLGRSRSGPLR